ncbi:hypothetical protein GF319_15755 [Candidatus Bathyarchaeota archaeon]|nr:hypothetical protein [Candidatus Bathyarchaeota archaeon]
MRNGRIFPLGHVLGNSSYNCINRIFFEGLITVKYDRVALLFVFFALVFQVVGYFPVRMSVEEEREILHSVLTSLEPWSTDFYLLEDGVLNSGDYTVGNVTIHIIDESEVEAQTKSSDDWFTYYVVEHNIILISKYSVVHLQKMGTSFTGNSLNAGGFGGYEFSLWKRGGYWKANLRSTTIN